MWEARNSLCGVLSFIRVPGLVYIIAGIPSKAEEGRLSDQSAFVLSHLLAKANHMGKPRFEDWKNTLHLMKNCKATLHAVETIWGHFCKLPQCNKY